MTCGPARSVTETRGAERQPRCAIQRHMSLRGAGSVRFWGFTPPLDLAEAASAAAEAGAPLRALLVGSGDSRHLVTTLAAARERPGMDGSSMPPPLELTVYEEAPEVLARQLLLLSIALDFEAHIPHNSHHEDSHFPARHSAHAPGASA